MIQCALEFQSPEPEYFTIPLTQGQVTYVESEDYEKVRHLKWYAAGDARTKSFYAVRVFRMSDGRRRRIEMARYIMNPPPGFLADHKNHNTLDNRRSRNLRIATRFQNRINTHNPADNKSGFKGVIWRKDDKAWQATIQRYGRRVS